VEITLVDGELLATPFMGRDKRLLVAESDTMFLKPRWTVQKQQLIDRQNQQFLRPASTSEFYFVPSSGRKSVWTLVRQLLGPHFSTCA
jgi:hypothetical protein